MDEKWREIFDCKASLNIPEHEMSCWSKEGYDELLDVTKKIFFDLKKSENDSAKNEIKNVLDVGCGPGAYCKFFKEQGLEVLGVDYSENTISVAKNKYSEINFKVEDGYNLSFDNKTFDLVISIGALQCLYDHEKFVNELIRVSKKFVIISTLYRQRKSSDPFKILAKQLKKDSWPTREYHPSELIELFEKANFKTKIIKKNGKKLIKDGFFVIAERKN